MGRASQMCYGAEVFIGGALVVGVKVNGRQSGEQRGCGESAKILRRGAPGDVPNRGPRRDFRQAIQEVWVNRTGVLPAKPNPLDEAPSEFPTVAVWLERVGPLGLVLLQQELFAGR